MNWSGPPVKPIHTKPLSTESITPKKSRISGNTGTPMGGQKANWMAGKVENWGSNRLYAPEELYLRENDALHEYNLWDAGVSYNGVILNFPTYKPPGLLDYSITNFIKPDGNCQFRAVSLLLTGNQDRHAEFRASAVAKMRENPKEYEPFVDYGSFVSLDDYCEKMSREKEYGDQLTLRALADACSCKILVLSDGINHQNLLISTCENELDNKSYLPLYLNHEHYEILVKDKKNEAFSENLNMWLDIWQGILQCDNQFLTKTFTIFRSPTSQPASQTQRNG
ncbi:hypothetical protein CROQUDRAFT_719089 [Cronartium quercuum f. sp. fusiforme G11]|uniref:OTU domain-containing protein n=1 Tax=Cronartium quercuum f. sp. fusiforme G11 TaxID=708437 RepID=A0A9P6N5H2_9BASI|nr:hypothetical protein CROQUDRAFT_719089 [Cronartium quercuum f. sp. fusiforme G11]